MCREAFTDMDSLVSHKEQHGLSECKDTVMHRVETVTKPHPCDMCREAFNDIDSLVSHKEQHGFLDECESEGPISKSNKTYNKEAK